MAPFIPSDTWLAGSMSLPWTPKRARAAGSRAWGPLFPRIRSCAGSANGRRRSTRIGSSRSPANGDLFCLSTADGRKLWSKSYPEDFGSPRPAWGFGDRPLVDGQHLICAPAGTNGAVVALNKFSGDLAWKSAAMPLEREGYGATVISEACGVRQYFVFLSRGLYGIAAEDGRVLWRSTNAVGRIAHSYTPIVRGDLVFCANGYGAGMALLKIVQDGETLRAEQQYLRKIGFNAFQDSTVLVGDHVYSYQMPGKPICIELHTGELAWGPIATGATDRAALTYAEGHIYSRRASGQMILQKATPDAYVEVSSFQIPEAKKPRGRPHPS
ncbi:MAG: PQQ-binding-like beta-propeller repeat protein [Verrucomicrobiia bacterium]